MGASIEQQAFVAGAVFVGFAKFAAALLVSAFLAGEGGVDALADDLDRGRDDIDRGPGDGADDASANDGGEDQDRQKRAVHRDFMPVLNRFVDGGSVHAHRFGGERLGFDEERLVGA